MADAGNGGAHALQGWGTMDTTEKISEIVSAIGGTFTDVFARRTRQGCERENGDGRTTAGEEVRQLIQMGNAAGQRMTAISTGNGTLVLGFTSSGTVTNPLVWTRDGAALCQRRAVPLVRAALGTLAPD